MAMARMRRWAAAVAVAALASVSVAGSGCDLGPLYKATRTTTVPHVEAAALEVETANGSIEALKAQRADVQVTAHLRAASQERLDAAEVVAQRADDGTLRVYVRWPDGRRRSREGCSFEVRTPGAVGVHLKTSNGAIETVALSGEARLETSNGRVTVRDHGGAVTARSSNGKVDLERVAGAVDVRTSNGAVRVEAAAGEVEAETSNGAIEVREATGRVTADTSNGAVRIALRSDGSGPIEAATSNGPITLELGPAFTGELELRTSNGRIHAGDLAGARLVSSGKHHLHVAIGEGGGKSVAGTSNGSITVRLGKAAE